MRKAYLPLELDDVDATRLPSIHADTKVPANTGDPSIVAFPAKTTGRGPLCAWAVPSKRMTANRLRTRSDVKTCRPFIDNSSQLRGNEISLPSEPHRFTSTMKTACPSPPPRRTVSRSKLTSMVANADNNHASHIFPTSYGSGFRGLSPSPTAADRLHMHKVLLEYPHSRR